VSCLWKAKNHRNLAVLHQIRSYGSRRKLLASWWIWEINSCVCTGTSNIYADRWNSEFRKQEFSRTVHSTDFPISREIFQRLQLLLDSIWYIHKLLRQFITQGHVSHFGFCKQKRNGLGREKVIVRFHQTWVTYVGCHRQIPHEERWLYLVLDGHLS